MARTDVLSSWMILADVSLHCALILLAMESGMTLAAMEIVVENFE